MTERLKKIIEENKRFEKKAPYNFCDRWCERCRHETQVRCRLYLDEFERKTTCIAHGKDEDDREITAKVREEQFEGINEAIEKFMEENAISPDELDDPDHQTLKEHINRAKNDPLDSTAKNYLNKASTFLKAVFYENDKVDTRFKYDLETISRYHMLLHVKLRRALAGFHEPACEGDYAMHDAVAQFEICKKTSAESMAALKNIKRHFPGYQAQTTTLIALLHNILSRVNLVLESI